METLNHGVLVALNRLVGHSPVAFEIALFLNGQFPLTVCVVTLLALWWTDLEGHVGAPALTNGPTSMRPGLVESRCRALMLGVAVTLAFVTSRIIAMATDLPRPLGREALLVPIDPHAWDGTVQAMSNFGAFPSDHAALYFAVATGLFAWSRRAGVVGLVLATVFSLSRVAIGFHYPVDMVVGAGIGVVIAVGARRLVPRLLSPLSYVVGLFDRWPAVTYPALFVASLDFVHHFQMVLGLTVSFFYKMLGIAGAV